MVFILLYYYYFKGFLGCPAQHVGILVPTRDRIHALGIGSTESQPLDGQGSPLAVVFFSLRLIGSAKGDV